MTCSLCGRNKARRACPALGRDICTVCCGTKRLVEIRCPDTCVHLSAARQHPPAVVQRQQARDASMLIPVLRDLTEDQRRLLFLLFGLVQRESPESSLQRLGDEDVADAAAALASTYETAARGVIYEHRPQSLAAQRLIAAIRETFDQLSEPGDRIFAEHDAPRTLRALERVARSAADALGAPGPRAFLDLAARVTAPMPATGASAGHGVDASRDDARPGLIIPGT